MANLNTVADRYLPEAQRPYGPYGVSFIDLETIRSFLWRQRYILIGVVSAVLALGLIITLLATPIYTATASVRFELRGGDIVDGQDIEPYIATNEFSRHMQTIGEVLKSRRLALRVVDALQLQGNEALLGDLVAQNAPEGADAEAWRAERRQTAAAIIQSSISVTVPVDSRIMSVSVSSRHADLAAQLANGYVDSLLQEEVAKGLEANSYARQYLEEQIADARLRLLEAENQAIDYARTNQIIGQPIGANADDGAGAGTAQTITAANLQDINAAYTSARAERIAAEQRWLAIVDVPPSQLPEVQQNVSIQSMRSTRAQIASQLADLRERYRDDYPDVRELTAQLASQDGLIGAAELEVKNSIRGSYDIAQRQEAALARELGRVSRQTLDEQDRRVQFNSIDRAVSSQRDQLALLMQRYNQISSAANLRSSGVTQLDEARVPGAPSSPDFLKNMIIALLLGLGIAGAIAVLREIFDDRLRSLEDVEGKLKLSTIGQTPFVADDIDQEMDSTFSPLSESYASIRASLDFAIGRKDHQILQFTSSQGGEGKTTSAIAVAKKYASIGRKTLLIDMDLRRPSVPKVLGLPKAKTGLVDLLYSRVSLADALVVDVAENLDVLPVGTVPSNPIEVLSSGLASELLEGLRAQYDVILIDSSPIMGIADAPLLSRFVDGVVFVVEANSTGSGRVKSAVRRLQDVNANVVGAILTKFRALEAGQEYSYQYSYYSYDSDG